MTWITSQVVVVKCVKTEYILFISKKIIMCRKGLLMN